MGQKNSFFNPQVEKKSFATREYTIKYFHLKIYQKLVDNVRKFENFIYSKNGAYLKKN